MCNQKYNGWRNWETWNCNLWFDNFFVDDAANMYALAEDENEAIMLLESLIEETITEYLVPDSEASFKDDILNMAIAAIDFKEIAEHYIEDILRKLQSTILKMWSVKRLREFYPVKQSRERSTGFYLSTNGCFV
jgi:hypothetical protein